MYTLYMGVGGAAIGCRGGGGVSSSWGCTEGRGWPLTCILMRVLQSAGGREGTGGRYVALGGISLARLSLKRTKEEGEREVRGRVLCIYFIKDFKVGYGRIR